MKPSLILSCVTRAVITTVVMFSLYLLFTGHNAPGGGFAGGLVAGAALVLAYASGGVDLLRRAVGIGPEYLLGSGLALAQVTAAAGWLLGDGILASRVIDLHLPVFGDVHVATPLFFDIGVYLVVVGLVAKILATLGGQPDRPEPGMPVAPAERTAL